MTDDIRGRLARDFEQLFDSAPVAIVVVDASGLIVLANRQFERLFGYTPAEVLGQAVDRLLPPHARQRHASLRAEFARAPQARPMGGDLGLSALRKDGTEVPVEVGLTPINTPAGMATIATIIDISERRRAEEAARESEGIYRALFDNIRDGAGVIQDARFVLVNHALVEMTGRTEDEVAAVPFDTLIDPAHATALRAKYDARMRDRTEPPATSEVRLARPDGSPGRWVEINARRIMYRGRRAALVTLRDTTARKENADRLEKLAHSDSLTGLANRPRLLDRLETALQAARRHGYHLAVLYLDLDGFKDINDRAGHQVGDRVLAEVARRLRSCVRAMDTVGRIGGDEFVIVLGELAQVEDGRNVADKIVEVVSRPMTFGEDIVTVGVSVGVAVAGAEGVAEALLRRADAALYEAKRQGKGRHVSADEPDAPPAPDAPTT